MNVLLDTHVLLWWLAGSDRLSISAAEAITAADHVLVSPISCWEVAMLSRDGRIGLDRPLGLWIEHVFEKRRSRVAPLRPAAAAWAGSLDPDEFPGDPADRMLYATARDLRVPFVSKDARISTHARRTGDVDVIW